MKKKAKPKVRKPARKISSLKIVAGFREWVKLPEIIKGKEKQAESLFQSIQTALILYRSYVITCDYFATNVDRNIWNSFHKLQNDMKELVSFGADYYIRFCSLKTLRSLDKKWDDIILRQKELDQKIEKAPSAFDFYNKMAAFKLKHLREEKADMEVSQKLSKAYKNLEKAMEYVEEYDNTNSISVFGASILSLEKAREYWGEKLKEIQKLEKKKADLSLIVNEMENLVKTVYDTPIMAKWVNDIEKRFSRLTYDHALLVDSYGKSIIQKELLEELSTVLYSAVPKMWAQGQKSQLNHHLSELESFVTIYQPELDSEIAFAERHMQHKEHSTVGQSQQLPRLVELTKVFITAMDVRDPLMRQHSLNVAHLAVATSQVMNWEQEEIQYLEIAALLHDIGKIWIPESILTKKGKLSADDIKMVRMHPVYGAQILQSSELFKDISSWIYHHQELWNGTGYPDGLKEEDIPIQSRIISVCESFDAMLSGSGTKTALSIEQALDRVKFEAGTYFDPIIVESFVKAVETREIDYLKKYVEK
ncbi:MAG: HD domain-containing protein [Chloroflexi bacterium]|nr:HD domain-containing protein [Chloroflexota bacterium]